MAGDEELKARAAAEAAKIREQAGEEVARLSALEDDARSELGRLVAVLSGELSARARDTASVDDGERSPSAQRDDRSAAQVTGGHP